MPPEQHSSLLPPENHTLHLVASENLPHELFSYPQWVCWRYVARGQGKKPDKQPVNPRTLGNAGVHWANTWCTFEQALSTYTLYQERGIAGLGFVLAHDDPFVGIDMDDCVVDGEIGEDAEDVIGRMASYTELSPSMQGLRLLISCPDYKENVRTAQIEIYSHSRFLTLTGHHVAGTPVTIAAVQREEITALFPKAVSVSDEKASHKSHPLSASVEPMMLWTRIFEHDQYGAQHLRRFQGDISLDRGDHSLAVIRLLNCLARWTAGNAAQMREMILLSPLANEKWLSKRGKGDWLEHQIRDAIAFTKKGK